MGRAARANKTPREPRTREMSGKAQRDHLRTTVPDFTRRSLLRYLGIEVKNDISPPKSASVKA